MKTKTTTIFTLTVIIFLIIAGICANYPFFLTQYAGFFSKSTASKGADALVVLTGPKGVMINRIPHALELYRHGYSQLILIPEERQPNLALKNIYKSNWDEALAILREEKIKANIARIPS